MKGFVLRLVALVVVTGIVSLLVWLLISGPNHPVALIRVVDSSGKPIAGAAIKPVGLRTKPGPYVSGWYGWRKEPKWPADVPVSTDLQGYGRVLYPKFVFEH